MAVAVASSVQPVNTIVDAAIAAGFALLPIVAATPTAPFGYGTDIWCSADLDPSQDVAGSSTLALAQALRRRLDCPRGQLVDDPAYGTDLRAELNRGTQQAVLNAIASRIRSECSKDERVSTVAVQVIPQALDGSSLRIIIGVTPVDTTRTTAFRLTLAVTSASVILEELAKQ